MTRQQPRWIGRSENAHFLPFVYFACSTGKCQRCVRNEEYYFDFARSHCRWDAFKYQGRTVQKRNYSIWLHSFRLSHLHLLTLISDPWTFCLIIVLISLSRIMRVSTFSGDDMPASEWESWPGCSDCTVKNTAALPIASVALCIFKRIQAIWSLFIVLQMTHNGNLACDERTWITDRGHETGINLHLISFKEDL